MAVLLSERLLSTPLKDHAEHGAVVHDMIPHDFGISVGITGTRAATQIHEPEGFDRLDLLVNRMLWRIRDTCEIPQVTTEGLYRVSGGHTEVAPTDQLLNRVQSLQGLLVAVNHAGIYGA
jgi:hypothetical protein